MPTFAIEYEYDARHDVQDAVRPAHRTFLRRLLADGALLASGPWRGDPVTDGPADASAGSAQAGALLLLRADSAGAALALLDDDPFRDAGVILSRTAREWVPVIGPFA